MQLNQDSLNKCRVLANIISGVSAGILGLGAFSGVLWWVWINFVASTILFVRIKMLGSEDNGESKFFKSAFAAAFNGTVGNLMTYLLFWIMFYNIVYVI